MVYADPRCARRASNDVYLKYETQYRIKRPATPISRRIRDARRRDAPTCAYTHGAFRTRNTHSNIVQKHAKPRTRPGSSPHRAADSTTADADRGFATAPRAIDDARTRDRARVEPRPVSLARLAARKRRRSRALDDPSIARARIRWIRGKNRVAALAKVSPRSRAIGRKRVFLRRGTHSESVEEHAGSRFRGKN